MEFAGIEGLLRFATTAAFLQRFALSSLDLDLLSAKPDPRRFNPSGEAWLPVFHTARGPRQYTALFSNIVRAHELNKTQDWVVLYYDGASGERQCTIITSEFGRSRGNASCVDAKRNAGNTMESGRFRGSRS